MVSQLSRHLPSDRIAPSDPQRLLRLRHTCAHVLAMAVQGLFPETRVTIGRSTETGFYYDFDRAMVEDRPPRAIAFTPNDLSRIEAEMRQIIRANLPIVRETAELEKIPVVAVVGKREVEQQTLSVRTRKDGDRGARPDGIAGADGRGNF